MSTQVLVPEHLFDDDMESVISTWFYANGEQVAAGAIIAEVMTEKVATEIEAPVAGRLKQLVAEEATVQRGQPIARLE